MNIKKIFVLFLLTVFSLFTTGKVMAGQYEEVETKDISLDKKVKNPNTGDWVDNLFSSDYKFSPDQEVEFKIVLKNVGNKDLDQVEYRDSLPEYLHYISGDTSATIYNFKVDEQKEFYPRARVNKEGDLPNTGLYCVINTAYAWIEGGESEKDTSQVCFEKRVLGEVAPAILPKAGPSAGLFILLSSALFAFAGWALIKKS